jgi:HprK-related kinase A
MLRTVQPLDGPEAVERTVAGLGIDGLRIALRSEGLVLGLGLLRARIRCSSNTLAGPLTAVYRHAVVQPADEAFADLHAEIALARGPRRWLRPQVRFLCDGQQPFEPFPADHAFPLMEWGLNWLIARRMNDMLLLHAGVLERDGLALVMPALPGSGKSTLTAALSLRGWRLLSDEFGALDPAQRHFRAVLKPVALKNESIGVIQGFEPSAVFGPAFDKTRKGTVSHLAPDAASVAARHVPARPGAVVFPRWVAGSATRLEPVHPKVVFSTLAFNAFNYAVLGASGFEAVVHLVRRCPAWQLIYSDLDDALRALDRVWPEVRERAANPASWAPPQPAEALA